MSESKQILILCLDAPAARSAHQLADALTGQGAVATVSEAEPHCNYEQILDAIALADTVICWR